MHLLRAVVFAANCVSFLVAASAFSQGELTPPGAPTPTMKTLDQIEARTPVSALPFTISAPGSYYLTANLSIDAGDAITIATNGVTLDLNGFTISSTASPAAGTAVLLSGGVQDVTIRNGHIRGGVAFVGGGGDQYTGPGFGNGISWVSAGPRNVKVSHVTVSGCDVDGIGLGSAAPNVIDHCIVGNIGGRGLHGVTVSESVAYNCGGVGIAANIVQNSWGASTASLNGINGSTVVNCSGSSDSGNGINAISVRDSLGSSNTSGIGIAAATAEGCYGTSGSGHGISANEATNCEGFSNSGSGNGVYATAAINCRGFSHGGSGVNSVTAQNCQGVSTNFIGLMATNAAHNCYGRSDASTGLFAGVAENSYGESTSGMGLQAANTAQNCFGRSTSNIGLRAALATHSQGESVTGIGLQADRAAFGSFGSTAMGSSALFTSGIASYCSGHKTGGGTAIDCVIAIGCSTFGGAIIAPQGKHLGTP